MYSCNVPDFYDNNLTVHIQPFGGSALNFVRVYIALNYTKLSVNRKIIGR